MIKKNDDPTKWQGQMYTGKMKKGGKKAEEHETSIAYGICHKLKSKGRQSRWRHTEIVKFTYPLVPLEGIKAWAESR